MPEQATAKRRYLWVCWHTRFCITIEQFFLPQSLPGIFSVPESRLVISQVLRYKTSLVMRLMTKLHHRLTRIWLGQISLQKIKGRETNYDRRNWINGCSFIFLLYFALKVVLNKSGREKVKLIRTGRNCKEIDQNMTR